MTEKDGEDGDDDKDGADSSPPESILCHFPRRAPPTSARLEPFRAGFDAVVRAYSGLVWSKGGGSSARRSAHAGEYSEAGRSPARCSARRWR
jgi:hypothetical protein